MSRSSSQSEINSVVWRACDTLRKTIDATEYKDYVLTMLFVKYLSDLAKAKRAEFAARYGGDKERVERAMSRERFVVPPESDFDHLYARREDADIGNLINIALTNIEDENKAKLENVFRNIDFNSEARLGRTKERNRILTSLLDDFNQLDLRPGHLADRDVIGDVYEYLIGRFAAGAGKKAGEFYTPPEVSTLLAMLLEPKSGNRICDPACGSGSLLIKVGRQVGSPDFFLAGQESNGSTWALCKMNMFLHGVDSARIEWCDTISNPRLVEDAKDTKTKTASQVLTKFDIVVANPPFSLDKWGQDVAEADHFHRFWRGIPPKSRGDYAFISHMVEIALEGHGKVGVVVPHGVLFRGGSEGQIRRRLLEDNQVEAVIGLPPNLFYGTGIPAALLMLNKGRKPWNQTRSDRDKHVLFIDASREFEQGTNQNRLRDADLDKIVRTFKAF
jgi:type I restriction enzyme M protein